MVVKEENLFAELRKQRIVDLVNKETKVKVVELCEKFSVSSATIRNDLRELEEAGLLKRTHGGAIGNKKVFHERNAYQKEVDNVDKKQAIAKVAASYVEKGDSIALDTGSTALEFAKQIADIEDLTIVTYDIQIAAYLEKHSKATIVMAGGILRRNFHCTSGKPSMDTLENFYYDKAFMAADGMSIKKGFTTPNMEVSQIKRIIKAHADEVIMLCDSTKVEKSSFAKFGEIEDVDLLITDDGAPNTFIMDVQKLGIDIQIARNENK